MDASRVFVWVSFMCVCVCGSGSDTERKEFIKGKEDTVGDKRMSVCGIKY